MIVLKSKDQLYKILVKQGYSKRGFARANGLSVATLIKISNGKQSPRPATAKIICNALNVSFDEIFEIVDESL